MKFSEISQEDWSELKPYLDTCLLPVTGLNGTESPYAAAEQLERLRDLLDLLERPFRGRTVTYPAYQYTQDKALAEADITRIASNLKNAGFRYVVVVSLLAESERLASTSESVDLVITPNNSEHIQEYISSMWQS